MFFLLSKLFHFFILPFSWVFILFILGLISKKTECKRRFFITSFCLMFFFSNTVIFKEFARLWEVNAKKLDNMKHYEVGIVLGGMAEYNNDAKRLSIRRGADRIWQAISLYKRHKLDVILISGDDGLVFDRNLKEAIRFKNELMKWGIPDSALLIETKSKNTYQNARYSVRLLRSKYGKMPSCLLITSALHMKRSKACFDKLGIRLGTFSTDHFTGPTRNYHWDEYFVPNVSTMANWEGLIHEWIGFMAYKLAGYC
jgi:uncharacterized SAM-binding protein YcdF (DUF218 family)